jgi:ABC-type polysaccharide/polyol phosphate transport system ATPase subunit
LDHVSVIFEHVGKRFRTGRQHGSLRDLFASFSKRTNAGSSRDDFWALRDVTLDIRPGMALGIIGPNGAGKSTVLKLLTGILRPTEGRIEVKGRIGALIELAAGFHPDLTGRDNVFLQGAIMGMRRADVAARFDEIVAFAGVEQFIDTPVKRYSNGMNARLGFAIAAHLDPDVLLIDEVLAVGDRAFQASAIAHVRATMARGVPVVLVTHQLDLVSQLCERAVLLSGGRVIREGSAQECVAEYVRAGEDPAATLDEPSPVTLADVSVSPSGQVAPGSTITVRVWGEVTNPLEMSRAVVALRIRALPSEDLLFFTNQSRAGIALPSSGSFQLDFDLRVHLGPGFYRVQVVVSEQSRQVDWARGPSAMISVGESPMFGGRVDLQPSIRLVDRQ